MKFHSQPSSAILFVATGVILAGVLATAIGLATLTPDGAEDAISIAEPINFSALEQDANLAGLERGRVYYAQLCISCHGPRGDGQGEWAYRVTPHPADLVSARVRARSDAYLFKIISDGLVATPMIGLKGRLSERQRWQIVAYLRHLGIQQASERRVGS